MKISLASDISQITVLLTLTRFAALAAEDPSIFPKILIFLFRIKSAGRGTSSCAYLLVHQTKISGSIQTGGITQSGEYSRYADNMDCRWNISSNTILELVFLRFKTVDQNDYLRVYDGGSSSSPLIGTYSGSSARNSYKRN